MPSAPNNTDDKDPTAWPEGYFDSFGPVGDDFVAPEPLPDCPHRDSDCALCLTMNVPNAETQAAMREARTIMAARHMRFASADELFDDLKKNSRD